MKLKLYNDENKEVRELELQGSSFAVIYNDTYGAAYNRQNLERIRFDDKHVLDQSYQVRVAQLIKKYSAYLNNLSFWQIAFVVDEEWVPSEKASKNSAWKIDIVKAPAWLRMILGYEYTLQMRQYWIDRWSDAQINAAIMSQLLRINQEDGNVYKYTEDFNSRLIATFGIGYLEPETVIPNLLTEDVKIVGFKQASGQVTIDEVQAQSEGETTKNVDENVENVTDINKSVIDNKKDVSESGDDDGPEAA